MLLFLRPAEAMELSTEDRTLAPISRTYLPRRVVVLGLDKDPPAAAPVAAPEAEAEDEEEEEEDEDGTFSVREAAAA